MIIAENNPEAESIFQSLTEEGLPPGVTLFYGSAFSVKADALVSPANSLGIMRGGFDGYIAKRIPGIEALVRLAIFNTTGTENLPVGETLTIKISHPLFDYLIVAPTMRRPGGACSLSVVRRVASSIFSNNKNLQKVVMTPLGTGVGGLDLEESVREILKAYNAVF